MMIIGIDDVTSSFIDSPPSAPHRFRMAPQTFVLRSLLVAVITTAPVLTIGEVALSSDHALARPGERLINLAGFSSGARVHVERMEDVVVVRLVDGSLYGEGSDYEIAEYEFRTNVAEFLADVRGHIARGGRVGGAVARDYEILQSLGAAT